MALVKWTEIPNPFTNSALYRYIQTVFAPIVHTHTKSDITDFSHTHTKSEISDLDTSLSSYTLTNWETTNMSTCDVKFYKQLNIVICVYHISTVSFTNTSDHTVTANEIPSTYRPSSVFYQDIADYTNTTSNEIKNGLLTIGTDGSMKIRMGKANTSMNVYGSLTYIV